MVVATGGRVVGVVVVVGATVVVVVDEDGVYCATHATCIAVLLVGHAQPDPHHACDCKLMCIGMLGISDGTLTVPHVVPSTVYVIDDGVHTTPHVCH